MILISPWVDPRSSAESGEKALFKKWLSLLKLSIACRSYCKTIIELLCQTIINLYNYATAM